MKKIIPKKLRKSLIPAFYAYVRYRRIVEAYLLSLRAPKIFLNEYNRLEREYKEMSALKLHFGCGPRVLKGWINIDIAPFEPYEKYLSSYTDTFYGEKIRGNINDFYRINILETGLPLPDNSVDVIFHEDFIEHLTQREQFIFLAETFRVLKPGAIHRINTPDLAFSMKTHSRFDQGKKGVHIDEWDKYVHKNVLTPNNLKEIAEMIGYKSVSFTGRDKSTADGIPREYRPSPERPDSTNIFADLTK